MRYISICQHVISHMETNHIEAVEPTMERLGYRHRNVYVSEYETHPGRAKWGCGLYQIENDGSLTLIDSDWDTSD